MNPKLQTEVLELYQAGWVGHPDARPAWLREMPSASDDTASYYRFFHELVRRHGPLWCLEIGTYLATSAAHLAHANFGGQVVTVDVDPAAKVRADALRLSNLIAVRGDSLDDAVLAQVRARAPYDVLFIDGRHDAEQAYREYRAYRPLLRDGGAIFFDDLNLDGLHGLWEYILDPKGRLDGLHYTGFGVAFKDSAVSVSTWNELIDFIKDMAGRP